MPTKVWDLMEHRGWGNSIFWIDWPKRKLTGHTTPFPEPGDIFVCPVRGKFKFVKVEGSLRVYDMWFADMEQIIEDQE